MNMESTNDEVDAQLTKADEEADGVLNSYVTGVVTQEQEQEGSYNDYTGATAGGSGGSNQNENKWNKNGFGQGDATMSMRTGKYTKEETDTIIRAVKEYCNVKQITVARLCSECDHKADLKGSWMEIAKCLPNRPVQSVYRHGLRQLHPFKRGAWSDEEVENLIGLVAQVGKKWAHIQANLNRSADSCRDKYREMDDSFIRGRWKENETEQLKRQIREYLRVDPTSDMKELGKMVESEDIKIPWSLISKRMGKRSRLSCFKKWQKMTGLYSPCDMHRTGASSDLPPNNSQQLATTNTTTTKHDDADAIPAILDTKSGKIPIVEEGGDVDVYLLSELVALDVSKSSDVSWEDLRVDNAQERWFDLLQEWENALLDDSLLALPLSEIAQLILERKLERKTNAQRAAETVEAVDLPNPLWNHD